MQYNSLNSEISQSTDGVHIRYQLDDRVSRGELLVWFGFLTSLPVQSAGKEGSAFSFCSVLCSSLLSPTSSALSAEKSTRIIPRYLPIRPTGPRRPVWPPLCLVKDVLNSTCCSLLFSLQSPLSLIPFFASDQESRHSDQRKKSSRVLIFMEQGSSPHAGKGEVGGGGQEKEGGDMGGGFGRSSCPSPLSPLPPPPPLSSFPPPLDDEWLTPPPG